MSDLQPLELISYAADKLGDLLNEVVFLGGAVVSLLITDSGAGPQRMTKDVDVAIDIGSLAGYYDLDRRLLSKGLQNDIRGPVCRYLHGPIILDIMPLDPEVLGFLNRWYRIAFDTAQPFIVENGTAINLINAPSFLATKMEAFGDQNREDHHDIFLSRDFGDVVRVIDGRSSILDDVRSAQEELRDFVCGHFAQIMKERYLEEAIVEHVEAGRSELVMNRIRAMADLN